MLGHLFVVALAFAAQDEPPGDMRFRDADVAAVLQAVSKVTGLVFLIDEKAKERLKGKIDAYVESSFSREKAIDMLNTSLKKAKLTTHPLEKVVVILRIEDARDLDIRFGNDPENVENSDKIITQIIPVLHLSVKTIDKDLRRLYPENGQTIADEENNFLIIRGSAQEIRRFLELLTHLDRSDFASLKIQFFALKHASADEAAKVLQELFKEESSNQRQGQDLPGPMGMMMRRGMGGGRSSQGSDDKKRIQEMIRIVGDTRTNSVIVAASPENLKLVEDVVAKLDVKAMGDSSLRIFPLRHANAKDLADAILKLFQPKTTTTSGPTREMPGWMRGRMGPQQPASQQATTAEGVKAIPDLRTNRLMVTADATQMEVIEEIVAALDIEYSEIMKIRVVALEHGEAEKISATVLKVFQTAQGAQTQSQTAPAPRFGRGEQAQPIPSDSQPDPQMLNVVADTRTNSVIVAAAEERLATVEDLIKKLDADVMDKVEFRSYSLTYANPEVVIETITKFFEEESSEDRPANPAQGFQRPGGRGQPQPPAEPALQQSEVKVVAVARTRSVIVKCSKSQIPLIDALVAEIDREFEGLIIYRAYHLKNAKAAEMAPLLKTLFKSAEGDLQVEPDERTNSVIVGASKETLEMMDDLIVSLDKRRSDENGVYTFKLHNANVTDVQEVLKGLIQGGKTIENTRGIPGRETGEKNNQGGGEFERSGPQVGGGTGSGRSQN
jgi:type II secretory pathway component GspD/PulD (secretin)